MKKVLEIYVGDDLSSLWKKEYFTVYHLFSSETRIDEAELKIATPLQAIRFIHKILKLDDRFGIQIDKREFEDSADCELIMRMRVGNKDRKMYGLGN